MSTEALFEVWVDGIPIFADGQEPLRLPEEVARRRADRLKALGRHATVVPDQSKRPPDGEMLQGV